MKNITSMYLLIPLILQMSCRNQDDFGIRGNSDYTDSDNNPKIEIVTDKAVYKPGETISITADKSLSNTYVRYTYLGEVISEQSITGTTWNWTPPSDDYKGYMITVYQKDNTDNEVVLGTVGVDVSSDWAKFPRYGFLSKFGAMSDSEQQSIVNNLNKYHINGIQFYDWHYRPQQPLAGTVSSPMNTWNDIANRTIYKKTVENYISLSHQKNMKAMFYNLCYGALDDADPNKVTPEMFLYKDTNHSQKDQMTLSSPFISNIYFVDPANTQWQSYLAQGTNDVYSVYDFDGYHIDQVGDRGNVYGYNGQSVNLKASFPSYINAMKNSNSGKRLVFNAVNQFGQEEMAKTPLDFLYTEVWAPNDGYKDLADILKNNYNYSNKEKNTVLAAYMNYDKAESQGQFNLPGVLMTNAVIFAFGGSHLELGEHMLGKEYFPNNNLSMSPELKENLLEYYDFLTAYQNLLRDGGDFNNVSISSGDGKINFSQWPPTMGKVAAVGKKVGNRQVVHLLNYTNANSLNWRDTNGTQAEAKEIKNPVINVTTTQTVNKVWYATPDKDGGARHIIPFTQNGNKITLKLPSLKYWGMIVIE